MNQVALFFFSISIIAAIYPQCSMASTSEAQTTKPSVENPSSESIDLDYGEMYIVQKRENSETKWQSSLNYSYGYSNPYIAIHGVQLNFNRKVNDFFYYGISGSHFFNSTKEVASEIGKKLNAQNIQTDVYEPNTNVYGTASVAPLSGLLNWFGKSTVTFDLFIDLGLGIAKYNQTSKTLPSLRVSLLPQAMLMKNFGITLGVQATFDRFSSDDLQNRMDTIFGIVGRF